MIKVHCRKIRLCMSVRHAGDRNIAQGLNQGFPVVTHLRQVPQTRQVAPAIRMSPRNLAECFEKVTQTF